MPHKKTNLRNLVQVDGARLDAILEQLPNSLSIFENLKAKLGVTIKIAKIEIEATSQSDSSAIRKIRRLEKYLDQNGLLNKTRPRRTPHAIINGKQYWWIKETFIARKVIIPAPTLLKKLGLVALTVWVSDPKRAPTPKDEWDWTGSFLFLPTVHYEDGKTSASLSGCSALQFIINAASDRPLFTRDWNEPFGRNSNKHPIEKLSQLGAFVAEERKLESLYYVRYITAAIHGRVQPLLQKYSDFQKSQISAYLWASHPDRGALANVINAGRAAVDAEGALDESA
jgi:hypothetical protein